MQGKRKEESTFPVSSSRDLFRWRQEGECPIAKNGKHRIAGKAVGGASRKRLSEGVVEKGKRKRFLAALEMTV